MHTAVHSNQARWEPVWGPGELRLRGPRPLPLQAASPPNQTSFVVSGLSENTQFYTAGVRLGYRISATVIRLCLP